MRSSKKYFLYFVYISLYVAASANAVATEKKMDTPANIPGTTKIDAEDVFTLVEKFPELLIIDARIRVDRFQGYLEGSISLPDVETNCASLGKVISSKNSPVIFYCNGAKCGRSGNSSKVATKCGYKNIYWFRGGFEEWKLKNLPFIKK